MNAFIYALPSWVHLLIARMTGKRLIKIEHVGLIQAFAQIMGADYEERITYEWRNVSDIHNPLVTIRKCSRCGYTHYDLESKQMMIPSMIYGLKYTHFAMCPTDNAPVLISFDEDRQVHKMV